MDVHDGKVTSGAASTVAVHRRRLLDRPWIFSIIAIFIGLVAGLAVVGFHLVYRAVAANLIGATTGWRMVVVPAAIGVLVAVLMIYVFPHVRGSGVNQTKAALYINNGSIPFRTVIGKFVCSGLAIGSGQSLGPEDPSLQIGAGLAAAVARRLRLSIENMRLIAPIGAAAGLAAAFNAPISSVLYVVEEVTGRLRVGSLGAVVLAAVASVVVERHFLGSEPFFRIPEIAPVQTIELFAYAVLGVVGGVASLVFVKLIGLIRPRLRKLPRWTHFLQPGMAGLLIGLVGLAGFPQVMGTGYDSIGASLHGKFGWRMLAQLAGLKVLATTLSFSSGAPGGLFAPVLFVGAMLGGAVGALQRELLPQIAGPVGTYALVGMGTLFAGVVRAPMTSVFMVLELSGNYTIILPVIISNAIAYAISRAFQPVPIYDLLSIQSGLDLPSMEEEREVPALRVEDAMRPPRSPVLRGSDSVAAAMAALQAGGDGLVLVRGTAGPWLGVDAKLLQGTEHGPSGETLHDALAERGRIPVLHPDDPLEAALQQIGDWPLLPVVHRADPSRLEGVVSLDDILDAYHRTASSQPPSETVPIRCPDPYPGQNPLDCRCSKSDTSIHAGTGGQISGPPRST